MSEWCLDELEDARSEIRRHHELITQLRSYLEWALDHYEDAAEINRLVNPKLYEIRSWLNRNVG